MADNTEKTPLLRNDFDDSQPANNSFNESQNQVYISPLAEDQPPAYINYGGVPMVTCFVCKSTINIDGKMHQHVVKCSNCNEATAIKNAPPGKKYIRCPCNCLLICKAGSHRIACPRPNCKRIITLELSPATASLHTMPGTCRVTCGHCEELFVFNTLNNSLARCPHCRKVSSVGHEFARNRVYFFAALALLFLIGSIIATACTASLVSSNYKWIALWIVFYLITLFLAGRAIYYGTMKVSLIEEPI